MTRGVTDPKTNTRHRIEVEEADPPMVTTQCGMRLALSSRRARDPQPRRCEVCWP